MEFIVKYLFLFTCNGAGQALPAVPGVQLCAASQLNGMVTGSNGLSDNGSSLFFVPRLFKLQCETQLVALLLHIFSISLRIIYIHIHV